MSHLVCITGATGNVGHVAAESLLARGVKVRAVARSKERLAALAAKGAETRAGDLADTAFVADAFRGATVALVMIPPNVTAPDLRAYQREIASSVTAAAKAAGVPRAVLLSSLGGEHPSGTGPIAGLHDFEEMLKGVAGLASVALRPGFFMENHLMAIPIVKRMGVNGSLVRGDLAMVMIATRDIAAAASDLLAAPAFTGHTVQELLGPRDYTMREATAILGAAIGKPDLAYVEFAPADSRKGMLDMGLSASMADAAIEMYAAFNAGRVKPASPRGAASATPTALERFAREVFAPAFMRNA